MAHIRNISGLFQRSYSIYSKTLGWLYLYSDTYMYILKPVKPCGQNDPKARRAHATGFSANSLLCLSAAFLRAPQDPSDCRIHLEGIWNVSQLLFPFGLQAPFFNVSFISYKHKRGTPGKKVIPDAFTLRIALAFLWRRPLRTEQSSPLLRNG